MNRPRPWTSKKLNFVRLSLEGIRNAMWVHGKILWSLPIPETLLVLALGVGCGGGSAGDSTVQGTDAMASADQTDGDPKCGTQPNGAPSRCWRAPAPSPAPIHDVPPPGGDPSVFGQCPVPAVVDEDAPLPPVGNGGPLDPVDSYTYYDQNGVPIQRTASARARQGRYNDLSMEDVRRRCKEQFGSRGSFGGQGGAGFSGGPGSGGGGIAH